MDGSLSRLELFSKSGDRVQSKESKINDRPARMNAFTCFASILDSARTAARMLSPDDVASACLKAYAQLPSRGKPQVRSNGQPEWTVLAGFVLADSDGNAEVIALGYDWTQMRSLALR